MFIWAVHNENFIKFILFREHLNKTLRVLGICILIWREIKNSCLLYRINLWDRHKLLRLWSECKLAFLYHSLDGFVEEELQRVVVMLLGFKTAKAWGLYQQYGCASFPLSGMAKPRLECHVQFGAPWYQTDMDLLEWSSAGCGGFGSEGAEWMMSSWELDLPDGIMKRRGSQALFAGVSDGRVEVMSPIMWERWKLQSDIRRNFLGIVRHCYRDL